MYISSKIFLNYLNQRYQMQTICFISITYHKTDESNITTMNRQKSENIYNDKSNCIKTKYMNT